MSPSEAVLGYVLDAPQSFCLYVTPDRDGVSRLPASRAEVGKLVAAYREEISSRRPSTTSAARLYSVLVKPPVGVLKTDLVVIPDGELNLIPFDGLTDTTGDYVLDSHVVSYGPSATVLSLIRQTKRPSPAPITFLGLGGVPYGSSAASAAANTKAGVQGPAAAISNPFDLKADPLPDLPNSTDEVTSAGEIFGKSSVLLLGANATEAALKAEPLNHFRIIQIAAHGIASMKPDRAALVLGEDAIRPRVRSETSV